MKGDIVMKIKVKNQTKFDDLEYISLMEKEMHLSSDHVLKLFQDKVAVEKKAYIRKKITIASMAACVMLTVAINWNSIYTLASGLLTKSTVMVQNTVLSEDDMHHR